MLILLLVASLGCSWFRVGTNQLDNFVGIFAREALLNVSSGVDNYAFMRGPEDSA